MRNKGDEKTMARKYILIWILSVMFIIGCTVYAIGDEDVPRINIADLKKMIDSGNDVIILDTQPKAVYDKGHIKGAISFPWRKKITILDTEGLPMDKLIVTYCDCGPGESDSADVAAKLFQMGFGDVKVLKDPSIQGWKKAGYPVE